MNPDALGLHRCDAVEPAKPSSLPGPPRLLATLLIAVGTWLYFIQEESLKRGMTSWTAMAVGFAANGLMLANWFGAAMLPDPPGFLTLVMPESWMDLGYGRGYNKHRLEVKGVTVLSSQFKPIRLGNLVIETPIALAPMAGVTNWPFRILCKEKGCGLVVTEFVSDKAILFESRRTQEMIELLPAERPAGVQIFGADPETMAQAATRIVELQSPDLIDINMGCPAPKVTKGRGGSSLLREPESAAEIVRAVRRAVAPLPVTVKFRIGWDSATVNAVEVAKRMEDAGAHMLTVHGRTREQHYSGAADWNVIAQVAASVSIPVLGNGDITTPEQAVDRLLASGCAGLAIGRGAMGNPWIFARTLHYLQHGEVLPPPSARERVETALRHLELMIAYRGEHIAVREMRKHAAWYLKGLWGAAEYRNRVNQTETPMQLQEVLLEYVERTEAYVDGARNAAPDDEAGELPASCDAYVDGDM